MKYVKNISGATIEIVGKTILDGNYYLIQPHEEAAFSYDSGLLENIGNLNVVTATDDSGNSDIIDINLSIDFLKGINKKDLSGRLLVTAAATHAGWSMENREFEVVTSTHVDNDGACSFVNGVKQTDFTTKLYDINNVEITDKINEANSVRTEVLWSPDYDIDLAGGDLSLINLATQNLRISVGAGMIGVGIPLTEPYVRWFIPSINGKYTKTFKIDGRANKTLYKTTTGAPYATNQFLIVARHDAGYSHDFSMLFEAFKE